MIEDLRHALRSLGRSPGFTAAAVLSLALGTGAATALFGVTEALLIRPLPYADADRLAILWNRSPGLGITEDWFSTAQYADIRKEADVFESLAIAIGGNENLTDAGPGGQPERVGVVKVSSSLLPMLGVTPLAGRLFAAEEDAAGSPPRAVLSHALFARRYGSDPRMVGRSIVINGKAHEVIGIAPRSFALPREVLPTLNGAERADVLVSLPLGPDADSARGHEDYNLLGKLRSGVSVREAQARLDSLTARLRRDHPEVYPPNGGLTFSVVPLRDQVVGGVRRPLLILLGAAAAVLAISCVNVANLMLSRGVARQGEIAVRAALGASGRRLVLQLLTESTLLALLGGMAGTAVAVLGLRWLRAAGERSVPRLGEVGLDATALLFTLLVSIACGVLFGLVPARSAFRVDVSGALRHAGRGTAGGHGDGNRLRRLLVVSELALAVALLVGGGLLARSVALLSAVPPGFDPSGVLTFEVTTSGDRYKEPEAVRTAYRELWERLERLPGVGAAGGTSSLPFSGMASWGPVTVEGRTPPPGERFLNADQRVVSGRYFEALRIPLRAGRLFDTSDTPDRPKSVIVDERMAAQLWPGQEAVGKRISLGDLAATPVWATVVGVVGRVKQDGLDSEPRIALYLAQSQHVGRAMQIVVRTAGDPLSLAGAVEREVRALDPALPVYRVLTMERRLESSLSRQRFTMQLLGLFSGVALTLAAIGVYGVVTVLVSQGTREIGVRMALGASPGAILGLVVRHGLALTAVGVGIGLLLALALGRVMRSLLFGVGSADPWTLGPVALLMGAVALIASAVPAWRATRIDPIDSLRAE